jgi:hypothetical protein
MNKIPAALLPRFPMYSELLKPFASMLKFHNAYPIGQQLDGSEVLEIDKKSMPIFATESLEKLVSEILVPLYQSKRFTSLIGNNSPLGVCFVKEMLPDIEQVYGVEVAAVAMKGRMTIVFNDSEALGDTSIAPPILVDEADKLTKEFLEATKKVMAEAADRYIATSVMFCKWADDLPTLVMGQPMIKDGAARLFYFSAGTDCTKDPPKRSSVFRMRGQADEEHLNKMVDITSRLLSDADTAIIVSGRNSMFFKDARRLFSALKPKVVCFISPSESSGTFSKV